MEIKKNSYPIWILLLFILTLISVIIILLAEFELPSIKSSGGVIAIISAFVGILVTMSVTSLLLNKQSEIEGLKDQSVIQFKKKQEVYHSFLEKIESTIVELTEKSLRGNEKQAYENTTKLENLIFQFTYLRIHMNEDDFVEVIENISEIFKTYNEMRLHELYINEIKNKSARSSETVNAQLLLFMQKMTKYLFDISHLLNKDLYKEIGMYTNNHTFEKMNILFNNCGLKYADNIKL